MKKYFAKFAGTGVLLCCLALCPAVQAFAEPDGSVIAARKKTWAKRGGEENDLASKSPVHSGDILNTNPVGRLQVLFRDDTVLMLAPSSQVAITGYIYAEDREPLMNLELAKGFVRLISGRLVEGHPGAMRVITPEATVGIQGTDAAITTEDGSTMVYGYQVSPDKPLLVMENATGKVHSLMNGMVFECFGDVNKPGLIRPMTDAEKKRLDSLSGLALGQDSESGGSMPAAGGMGGEGFQALSGVPRSLSNTLQPAESSAAPILPPTPPLPAADYSGVYSGTLSATNKMGNWNGNFAVRVENIATTATVTKVDMQFDSPTGQGVSVNGAGQLARFGEGGAPANGFTINGTVSGGGLGYDRARIAGLVNDRKMDLNYDFWSAIDPSEKLTGTGAGQKR